MNLSNHKFLAICWSKLMILLCAHNEHEGLWQLVGLWDCEEYNYFGRITNTFNFVTWSRSYADCL